MDSNCIMHMCAKLSMCIDICLSDKNQDGRHNGHAVALSLLKLAFDKSHILQHQPQLSAELGSEHRGCVAICYVACCRQIVTQTAKHAYKLLLSTDRRVLRVTAQVVTD